MAGAQGQASVNPETRPSAQSHPGSGPIVGPGPRAGGVTSSRVMRNLDPGTVGYVGRRYPEERAGRGPLARAGRGSWAGGVGPLGRRGACAAALAWGLAGRLPAGTSPWPRSQGWGDSLVPGRWITPGGALRDRGAATPPLPVLGTPEQVRGGQGYKAGTWQPGPQEPSTNYVQTELRWWVPARGIWTVCHVGPSCPPPTCAGAEGVVLREGEPGRGVSPSLVGANLGSVGSFRETVGFCHLGTTPAHVPEGKLTGPSSKGWKPEPGLFLIRGLRSRVPGLLLEGAAGFGQVPYSSPQEQ